MGMNDPQSALMFITGVVGRAMGSGKYLASDILGLTGAALDAYRELLDPITPAGSKSAPRASQGPSAPYKGSSPSGGGGGFKRPFDLAANWEKWKGDLVKFGKKESPLGKSWGDCTWEELARLVAEDNGYTVTYLEFLRDKADVNDPKWGANNAKRRDKAVYVLSTFGKYPAQDQASPDDESTPF